jgi:hypothetical protein
VGPKLVEMMFVHVEVAKNTSRVMEKKKPDYFDIV